MKHSFNAHASHRDEEAFFTVHSTIRRILFDVTRFMKRSLNAILFIHSPHSLFFMSVMYADAECVVHNVILSLFIVQCQRNFDYM